MHVSAVEAPTSGAAMAVGGSTTGGTAAEVFVGAVDVGWIEGVQAMSMIKGTAATNLLFIWEQ